MRFVSPSASVRPSVDAPVGALPPTFPVKLGLARALGTFARRTGRGGGTSLPGKVLTRLEPAAIATLAARLPRGNVVVSATNGKTTTAAMVASILRRHGISLVHNRTGANMGGGIAATLAAAARRGGRELTGDLGVFEVDELWLAPLVEQLDPQVILLGNLFRDQLDRCGEIDTVTRRWAELAAARTAGTRFVACADDPLVTTAVGAAHDVTYYGIDDPGPARDRPAHAADAGHCRSCGSAYHYDLTYLAHLGHWRCPRCAARRPTPRVAAGEVELHGIRSAAFTLRSPAGEVRVELPLPGVYNVYNAVGAAALCLDLDVPLTTVAEGLAAVTPAFGRAETFRLGDRELVVLLIKNPTGADEVLRTLSTEGDGLDLLGVLNDHVADGRDVSWIWDIDWEVLAPRVRRITCAGTRAADLAIRLKHAGVPCARLEVCEDVGAGLDRALADAEGPLYAVPTYTAMLALRALLAARGHTRAYWR